MTAAVITASSSLIVAVVVYVLNTVTQRRAERRRTRAERLARQLRELYGPLNALVGINERLWSALHEAGLPAADERRAGEPAGPAGALWDEWFVTALLPTAANMRDLLLANADLLVDVELPAVVKDFCAHVSALEVAMASPSFAASRSRLRISHPGAPFVAYVQDSYRALKQQHSALVGPL